MKGIALKECVSRLFEILKLSFFSKLSGKFFLTSQNSAFYHLVDYFELEKKIALIENIPQSAHRARVAANLISRLYELLCPFDTFVLFITSPFLLLER